MIIPNSCNENDIKDGKCSNTIYDIVTMIKDKLGVPRYSLHMLFVHGEEVNEKSSLDDCHIEMGSTLFFMALIKPMQQILLKGYDGKTFSLEVKTSDTIIDVRIQILRKLNIPVCMQKLFFAEEELEDDFTLVDYYIHYESTLRLVPRLDKYILVSITTTAVTGSNTTRDVKTQQTLVEVSPKDKLVYNTFDTTWDEVRDGLEYGPIKIHIKVGYTGDIGTFAGGED
ncbi:polyubiquitin 11 [Tanacetum coccineum]